MRAMERAIRILAVSDIHGDLSRVNDVLDWCVKNDRVCDVVLCSGDIATMSPDDAGIVEKVAECEATMSAVLSGLEGASTRLLFVPGNHDSPNTFTKTATTKLTTHSTNIHGRCARLDTDLVVVGLGGSTPAMQ